MLIFDSGVVSCLGIASNSIDHSFSSGWGALNNTSAGIIYSISLQADGKILIAGGFTSYNGINRGSLARITPTGANDAGFVPPSNLYPISFVQSLSDGRVIIAGGIQNYGGSGKKWIKPA